jgi:hypothetical protein
VDWEGEVHDCVRVVVVGCATREEAQVLARATQEPFRGDIRRRVTGGAGDPIADPDLRGDRVSSVHIVLVHVLGEPEVDLVVEMQRRVLVLAVLHDFDVHAGVNAKPTVGVVLALSPVD